MGGQLPSKVISLIPPWEGAIEGEFNHWKLHLTAPAGPVYVAPGMSYTPSCPTDIDIFVRANFSTSFTVWTEDQSVSVDGTTARSDMTHWHLGDPDFGVTGIRVVHEVGHMLGWKDEYIDPVNYPAKVTLPPDASLSIINNLGGHVLGRQMQEILDYSHYKDHILGTYVLARR